MQLTLTPHTGTPPSSLGQSRCCHQQGLEYKFRPHNAAHVSGLGAWTRKRGRGRGSQGKGTGGRRGIYICAKARLQQRLLIRPKLARREPGGGGGARVWDLEPVAGLTLLFCLWWQGHI